MSESNPQFSPIYTLDTNTLWEIFFINSFNSPKPKDAKLDPLPLNTIRRTSHVCHAWREILLDSPSLWGRCIDVDLLKLAHEKWRNTVIQRTGQSLLSVTGTIILPLERSFSDFLDTLFYMHWERIHEIRLVFDDFTSNSGLISQPIQMLQAFGRATDNLGIFSVRVSSTYQPLPSSDFQQFRLFADHAPSLVHFYLAWRLKDIEVLSLDITTPAVFTSNLRSLSLSRLPQINYFKLLTACSQMCSLELLELSVDKLIISDVSKVEYLQLDMPKLVRISINTSTPDFHIYPAFLGRIHPHPKCTLVMEHSNLWTDSNEWSDSLIATRITGIEHMKRVLDRYVTSFLKHYEIEADDSIKEVVLTLTGDKFKFGSYGLSGHSTDGFRMTLRGYETYLPPETGLRQLVALFSNIQFPRTANWLKLTLPFNTTSSTIITPSFLNLLPSMASIAQLLVTPSTLCYLGELSSKSDHLVIFPALKHIILRHQLWPTDNDTLEEDKVMHFLLQQHHATPLNILELTFSRLPYGNLIYLNKLVGLLVRWEAGGGKYQTYVCGSGSGEVLFFE